VTATAANGGNFCGAGELTASGASTYSWSPAAQLLSSTGSSVTSIATANTTFTVTGTDGAGCQNTATVSITYTAPSEVTLTATPSSFCGSGGTSVLSATSANPNYTYTWTALDGAVISNVQPMSVDAAVTQTSGFQLTASDAGTGCSVVQFQSVGVYPLPSATMSITPNTPQCPGAPLTINSGLSSGNFSSASIPHAPLTAPGTATVLATGGAAVVPQTSGSLDDGGWGGIPIGFTFNFFGTPYTTCNVGTNGTIMFDAYNGSGLGDFSFTTLPSTLEPLGMVAVLAMDNHLTTSGGQNGRLQYWTEGIAPNRRFVVQYLNVREYNDVLVSTAQAIFYETTGVVEVHVTSSTNVDRNKLVGINGPDGTIGVLAFASGTTVSANNPISTPFAYRFSPPSNYTTTWTIGGVAQTPGSNQFTLSDIPTASTTYSISYTNTTTGCTNAPGSAQITYTSGTPITAGTISPASPTVCPGGSVVLTATPTDGVAPHTYQWRDPSAALLGTSATQSATLSGTYEVDITDACGNTITVSVNVAPINDPCVCNAYCVPVSSGGSCLTQVSFHTLSNSTGGCQAGNYSFQSATASVGQGTSYTLSLTTDGDAITSVWFDWDADGQLEASEWTQVFTTGTTGSVSISVPIDAVPGSTRMRVRSRLSGNSNGAGDACSGFGSGECEDYCITVTPAPQCSGTPTAGAISSTANPVCSGANFTLSVTGDTGGVVGLSYQWYSSSDGVSFTPIAGATSASYSTSMAATTWYRREIVCANGGGNAFTGDFQVILDIPVNCYCTTGLYTYLPTGTSAGDLISSVSITGATLNNNSGFVAGGPAYNFYAPNPPTNTLTADLQAGSSYTVNVSTGEWGQQGFAVWIDYNDNGVYETPSERIGATSGQVGSGFTSGQINASASFPVTLACNPPIGAHRMRVRCVYNVNGVDILPCATYTWGEVEEYIVNVTAPDPCPTPSGLTLTGVTPNTVSISWTTGCVETNWQAVIVADGAAPGTGTPVAAAATNATFTGLTVDTPYDVYVRANCLGNGFSSWVGPLDATPQALVPFSGDVTITGCGYTLYDHGGPAGNYSPGASGYAVLTPTPGNGLQITGTYDIENFFSEDFLYIYDGAGTSGTLLGVFTGSGSLNVLGTGVNTPLTVAFSSGGFFEFSGFALNVTCLPSCTGTPAPGATTASQSVVCPGVPINLGISNSLSGAGLSYIWQSSTTGSAGPWTTIATTSVSTYTVPTQSVNTWYRARVNCAGSGQTGVATPVQVTMSAFCYPAPVAPTSSVDTDIAQVSVGSGTSNTACGNTAPGAGSVAGVYSSFLNQPALTSLVRGGSAPFSVTRQQCGSFGPYSSNVAIYIDLNQNGQFEDTEEVFDNGSLVLATTPITGSISIPLTATLGLTGMRVIAAESSTDLTPSTTFQWGEVEDYVVNIVAPAVANDFPSFAVNVTTGAFPTCSASQTVNLALASDSPETAGSGNDAWYAFTAQTNAVRIQVTGSSDNRVELYNGATLVASENDVTANGNETLVFDGLTAGTSYLVAVIANGAPASASVCISHLRRSGCSAPSSAFPATFTSPCQQFKSIFTSASSYTAYFDVNGTAPFDGTSVATPNTTYHPISSFVGLPPLTGPVTYQVRVDATYNLTDAAGNPVTAVVPGTFNCTRSVVAHADVVLRTQDASPNVRPANAMIAANTWLCGALYYEWTIQQFTAIGGSPVAPVPTVVNGPPTNRFLNLFPLGLVPNGIYKVNVRPIFPSGPGNQGPDRWLIIAGPAMMGEQEEEGVATLKDGVEATIASALYPNPSNGSFVNLNITGVDANVMVRVLDGMGRVVWTSNLVVEGSLNTIIAFERPLASGLYMVEMTYDGQVVTERLMVQK